MKEKSVKEQSGEVKIYYLTPQETALYQRGYVLGNKISYEKRKASGEMCEASIRKIGSR